MPLILSIFAVVMPLSAPVYPVDFLLSGQPPTTPISSVPSDVQMLEAAPPPLKPQFSMVQGFGHHVPLSFAVRQIVPPAVHVSYGPGVSLDTVVDWKGGAPWNRILKAAMAPAGLHTHTGHLSVRISKE